jgi:hypothetical protein
MEVNSSTKALVNMKIKWTVKEQKVRKHIYTSFKYQCKKDKLEASKPKSEEKNGKMSPRHTQQINGNGVDEEILALGI